MIAGQGKHWYRWEYLLGDQMKGIVRPFLNASHIYAGMLDTSVAHRNAFALRHSLWPDLTEYACEAIHNNAVKYGVMKVTYAAFKL